jgi:hypothetical protein
LGTTDLPAAIPWWNPPDCDCLRLKLIPETERMAKNWRLVDNFFVLHEVMKQTVDGLHRGTLSRRDNTLLTVGFSLRTKQEQTLKVPQGRYLTMVESFRLRVESDIGTERMAKNRWLVDITPLVGSCDTSTREAKHRLFFLSTSRDVSQ